MLKRLIPAVILIVGAAASASFARPADSVSYERPNTFRIIPSSSPVRAFAVLGNNLWYATDGALNLQPLNNTRGNQRFTAMGGIPATGITAIVFDRQGRVWIAAAGGVAMNTTGGNFTAYTSANGLPEGAALSMAVGGGGEIWVGTENGAARFHNGAWTVFTTEQGLPSNRVQALLESHGKIYMGTNRGLSVFDGTKFENYNHRNTGDNGLDMNDVKVLAKEVDSDVIWMTDGPNNVNSFNGVNWKRFMGIRDGITSIMHDTQRMWFGSPEGLDRFNGEVWTSDPNRHGVPVQKVFAMYRDANGDLWFAMEKGVMHLNNPYRR